MAKLKVKTIRGENPVCKKSRYCDPHHLPRSRTRAITVAIENEITGMAMLSRNCLPWTKEDDERLKAFVAQGASVIRAAAELRRTTINVRAHARVVGCPFPSLRIERQADEVTADRPYGPASRAL
jgi:hypothetical protein